MEGGERMKIAGIIAEYNPFHNGHAWHIAETRRRTGCEYVVVCMDGHFTQRGEAAVLSRWDRAACALRCGADAVFELPALFAIRAADAFARGGVGVLGGLGVDVLSFGSELADLDLIEKLANIHRKEPTSVSYDLQCGLSEGMSHARAWGEAVAKYLGVPAEALNSPNLILAAEYVRAIRESSADMEPLAIPRRGGYHDDDLGAFASASAIRGAFERGEIGAALACVPEAARLKPDKMHTMDDLLLYRLREMSAEALAALPDMSEGLEHRLYLACRAAATRRELLDMLKCKRYTRARLSRMLTHAALGMTADVIRAHPAPAYARLLGMRRDAAPLLRELKRRARLPIVSNPSPLRDDAVFQLECRATDFWALLHDAPERRLPGREFTEKFIMI